MKKRLERLVTKDKSNLINAINEARQTGQGHNLIKNSENYIFDAPSGEKTNVVSKGKVVFTKLEESFHSEPINETLVVDENTKMILSVDLYNDTDSPIEIAVYFNYRDESRAIQIGAGENVYKWVKLEPKTWTKYTNISNISNPNIVATSQNIGIINRGAPATILYKNLKLEYGVTPTAYTKSLDDYVALDNKEPVKAPSFKLGDNAEIRFNSTTKEIEFLLN